MQSIRVASLVLLVVLAGGPVLAVVCQTGCAPAAEAAGPAAVSCHSTAPDGTDGTALQGVTTGACDHGVAAQAVRSSGGPLSGAFHKAVVESAVSRQPPQPGARAAAAHFHASVPPGILGTGFALPLRI